MGSKRVRVGKKGPNIVLEREISIKNDFPRRENRDFCKYLFQVSLKVLCVFLSIFRTLTPCNILTRSIRSTIFVKICYLKISIFEIYMSNLL